MCYRFWVGVLFRAGLTLGVCVIILYSSPFLSFSSSPLPLPSIFCSILRFLSHLPSHPIYILNTNQTIWPRMFYRSGWLRCDVFNSWRFWLCWESCFMFWPRMFYRMGMSSGAVLMYVLSVLSWCSVSCWFDVRCLCYYTILFSFPILLLFSSSSPIYLLFYSSVPLSSSFPSHLYSQHQSDNLTPHVLSEWMVEVWCV